MKRNKNLVIQSDNEAKLIGLLEDYQFLGRDAELFPGKLVVFAVDRRLRTRKQKRQAQKQGRAHV